MQVIDLSGERKILDAEILRNEVDRLRAMTEAQTI
jgi:hypothetical protein